MDRAFDIPGNVEDFNLVQDVSLQIEQPEGGLSRRGGTSYRNGERFMRFGEQRYRGLWLATDRAKRFMIDEDNRELFLGILNNVVIILICALMLHVSKTESPLNPLRMLVAWNIVERLMITYCFISHFVYGNHFGDEERNRLQLLITSIMTALISMFSFFPRLVMSIWILVLSFGAAAPMLYTLCCALLALDLCFAFLTILDFLRTTVATYNRRPTGGSTRDIDTLGTYRIQLMVSGEQRVGVITTAVHPRTTITDCSITMEDNVTGCCICLCDYQSGDEVRRLLCAHYFHRLCADKWLMIDARCPLCKKSITISSG
ncbi:hypothetical protein O6H91_07G043600 [Diphasiastrum complanatum]|uniref:Uncharacterized protein n=1 Tax=Diphasiastrum complanatum TaxID=34168 RepID=A0ACC2D4M9_DIPCM|nr:hypothetical protein O6H91_07G043600 [Diphasiastrum complanatum]